MRVWAIQEAFLEEVSLATAPMPSLHLGAVLECFASKCGD